MELHSGRYPKAGRANSRGCAQPLPASALAAERSTGSPDRARSRLLTPGSDRPLGASRCRGCQGDRPTGGIWRHHEGEPPVRTRHRGRFHPVAGMGRAGPLDPHRSLFHRCCLASIASFQIMSRTRSGMCSPCHRASSLPVLLGSAINMLRMQRGFGGWC